MKFVQPLAQATILAVGFGVFCALIGSWVSEQVRHATRRNDPAEQLMLKGDGTPIVMNSQRLLDANEPLQPPKPDEVWLDTAFMASTGHTLWPVIFDDWHWRLRTFPDPPIPGEDWYFRADPQRHGTGHFARSDCRGKPCLCFFG